MTQYHHLTNLLSIDCENCCGLCCTVLCFSKTEGFPYDKPSEQGCKNLLPDFKCRLHPELKQKGFKGCIAYDCFGAGQRVTQKLFNGKSWLSPCVTSKEMYDCFQMTYQLHQMLWYLAELAAMHPTEEIDTLIAENEKATASSPSFLLSFDLEDYRGRVNHLLKQWHQKELIPPIDDCWDFMGKDLRKFQFDQLDLSMSLLIAANLEGRRCHKTSFLGADLRDANLKNADLSKSLFLTQGQINSAKGNKNTRLPQMLKRPQNWE